MEWSKIVGQNQAIELLERSLELKSIAPAYLFVGANGIGRKLTAKCFCHHLLCVNKADFEKALQQKKIEEGNHPDLLWIEPTYQYKGEFFTLEQAIEAGLKRKSPPGIRIEQVREIGRFLSRPPLESERAMVVIESAETMTEGAANALLKTLEEPGRATLILIAPATESLLPTLVSRCQRVPFYRLSESALKEVLKKQGYGFILEQEEIIGLAQGSPGEAINISETLETIPEDLRNSLLDLPSQPLQLMNLAKNITNHLDTETQIHLINYLQYCFWKKYKDQEMIKHLEGARGSLLSYAQPRLVWECILLKFLPASVH
ncbi:MAG: hypothetical protein N5P05_002566 [Chroococcopsis gigantea SAG 12.99]|jgi:DNA polymerase-3 subunit delta'|nr:DNA polymerase III subunit delta' [Chlorogloea purpurea SAG 13.99]MDV3000960.1 hypothetical protein [Chroococcopsis gigantea SAG 12.99]